MYGRNCCWLYEKRCSREEGTPNGDDQRVEGQRDHQRGQHELDGAEEAVWSSISGQGANSVLAPPQQLLYPLSSISGSTETFFSASCLFSKNYPPLLSSSCTLASLLLPFTGRQSIGRGGSAFGVVGVVGVGGSCAYSGPFKT